MCYKLLCNAALVHCFINQVASALYYKCEGHLIPAYLSPCTFTHKPVGLEVKML